MAFDNAYRGKRVLVTGHTGFKGAWLTEWLLQLGADVTGLALPPATEPALFHQLSLAKRLTHRIADVRDLAALCQEVDSARPEFLFHLAAQALVRKSYEEPVQTYATNVLGTVHLLEAVRLSGRPCVVVVVTSDKCYENREWVYSYREEDQLGGYDPYSSSKGATELVVSGYRRSFFNPVSGVRLASVRAGNVVGGGDWAADRIVPDCVRALKRGEPIPVRNKRATRPWQHVLEPLSGYLWLGACLSTAPTSLLPVLCSAFNFGPTLSSNRTVENVVREILKHWPGRWEDRSDPNAVHEAKLLNLAIDKAHQLLGWQPVWDFEQTIGMTMNWYRDHEAGPAEARALTMRQIGDYVAAAKAAKISWAGDAAPS